MCGRTHRVRQKSRSDFWTSRRSRGGPERSGGRAADPGREQSHPLRHIKSACLAGLFYWAVQDVWTNPPSSTKIAERFLDVAAQPRRSGAKRRTSGRPRPRAISPSPPHKKRLSCRPFLLGGAGCVDEPTEFDKNRGAIFGRRGAAAAVRSEAEDERPTPAASNPTLSAT